MAIVSNLDSFVKFSRKEPCAYLPFTRFKQ